MGTNSDCSEQTFTFSSTVQFTGLQRRPGTQETQVWGGTARNNGNRNSSYSLECLNPREGLATASQTEERFLGTLEKVGRAASLGPWPTALPSRCGKVSLRRSLEPFLALTHRRLWKDSTNTSDRCPECHTYAIQVELGFDVRSVW